MYLIFLCLIGYTFQLHCINSDTLYCESNHVGYTYKPPINYKVYFHDSKSYNYLSDSSICIRDDNKKCSLPGSVKLNNATAKLKFNNINKITKYDPGYLIELDNNKTICLNLQSLTTYENIINNCNDNYFVAPIDCNVDFDKCVHPGECKQECGEFVKEVQIINGVVNVK